MFQTLGLSAVNKAPEKELIIPKAMQGEMPKAYLMRLIGVITETLEAPLILTGVINNLIGKIESADDETIAKIADKVCEIADEFDFCLKNFDAQTFTDEVLKDR